MEQIELFDIESPCRGICQSSSKGYCKGCLRSRDERFHWHEFSQKEKRHVIQLCRQRWQRILKAKQQAAQSKDTALPYGMAGEDVRDLFAHPMPAEH